MSWWDDVKSGYKGLWVEIKDKLDPARPRIKALADLASMSACVDKLIEETQEKFEESGCDCGYAIVHPVLVVTRQHWKAWKDASHVITKAINKALNFITESETGVGSMYWHEPCTEDITDCDESNVMVQCTVKVSYFSNYVSKRDARFLISLKGSLTLFQYSEASTTATSQADLRRPITPGSCSGGSCRHGSRMAWDVLEHTAAPWDFGEEPVGLIESAPMHIDQHAVTQGAPRQLPQAQKGGAAPHWDKPTIGAIPPWDASSHRTQSPWF